MRRLNLALQGYETLAAALQLQLDEAGSDRAEDWLREEVCPICEELVRHRSFQLAARWSVDHLEPGVQTAERRLVEATDAAIVRLAKVLTSARPESDGQNQAALGDAGADRAVIPATSYQTLEWIAGRPWFDLVSPEEYFHAERGLHLNRSDMEQTRRVHAFRELRVPLGDYVSRSLFARIDYWKELLENQWNSVKIGRLPQTTAERLFNAKVALDEASQRLREACCVRNETRLREAATTLTQVYAAYAPAPRLDWLGFLARWAQASQPLIRSVIRRRGVVQTAAREASGSLRLVESRPASLCDPTVLRHIAAALDEARVFYEAPQEADDFVEWTKDRVRLLMVDRAPSQLYWDGMAIADNQWDSLAKEWNLLWILARNLGRVVDQEMLIKPEGEAIRSRRSRLSRLLCDSAGQLDVAIETVRGLGYRLQLSAEDVVLLRDDGTGQLIEEGNALTGLR